VTVYSETGERKSAIDLENDKPIELHFDVDQTSLETTPKTSLETTQKTTSVETSSKTSSETTLEKVHRCVFWNFDTSDWSTDGCETRVETFSIVCRCRHLTNFAVLVSLRHTNEVLFADAFDSTSDAENLRLITLVGCSCSAVALFVALIFFVGQGPML